MKIKNKFALGIIFFLLTATLIWLVYQKPITPSSSIPISYNYKGGNETIIGYVTNGEVKVNQEILKNARDGEILKDFQGPIQLQYDEQYFRDTGIQRLN